MTVIVFIFFFVVVVAALRAMLHKVFLKPRFVLRDGKKSFLYFHLNAAAGKIKYGRAVNPEERFKTHLSTNEDLIPLVVYPEVWGFNETILKTFYGGDEQVPIDDDIIKVMETGTMAHLRRRKK